MTSEIYILLDCQALSGEMGGEEHLCCHGDFRMHMDTYVIKYLHQNSVIYETARQWCWKKEGRNIYYVGVQNVTCPTIHYRKANDPMYNPRAHK